MAQRFSAQLLGAPELLSRFRSLSNAVATEYVGKSMDAGVGVIRDAILRQIPTKTGTLRGALAVKTISQSRDKVVKGIFVGPNAYYWRFLEFGTKRGITPREFVRKPFRNRKSTARQTIRDTFRDLMLGFTD